MRLTPLALLPLVIAPCAALPANAQRSPVLTPQQAQAPIAKRESALTYDVVAIKPNKSVNQSTSWSDTGPSFVATNITIKMLIQFAYHSRDGLIFGLPGWAETAHFDVNAKIADPDLDALKKLSDVQRRAMLAQVLADRFQLKLHPEVKTLPVYNLTVGKDGPKFKDSAPASGPAKADPVVAPGSFVWNTGEMTAVAIPLSTFARMLEDELNRNIIDRTGRTGNYDLHLKWTPDRSASAGPDSGQASTEAAPPLFTALQEQLGLKLQPGKGPVETLVVDHVEQPTEN